jgi:hypothetical protein
MEVPFEEGDEQVYAQEDENQSPGSGGHVLGPDPRDQKPQREKQQDELDYGQ